MDKLLHFDNLKFSLRKNKTESITFDIDHDNHQFILFTPRSLKDSELEEYLKDNLKDFKDIADMFFDRSFLKECVEGETLQLFNSPYTLCIVDSDKLSIDSDNGIFYFPKILKENFIEELIDMYSEKLLEFVSYKLDSYRKKIGAKPQKVIVSELKRKWGVCTPKGTIKLNWKIAMAPYFVVEYVLCHEMVHLKHLDHSKEFYKLLNGIFPRRIEAERWLENNFLKLRI